MHEIDNTYLLAQKTMFKKDILPSSNHFLVITLKPSKEIFKLHINLVHTAMPPFSNCISVTVLKFHTSVYDVIAYASSTSLTWNKFIK